jgi:hypothetical protein
MSPEKKKGHGSYLSKAHWKRSAEKSWPVLTADFSKFPKEALPDEPFVLKAEDQSPCAIAGRNLQHIGIFHYNDTAPSPQGEVYDYNHIEVNEKTQRIRITGTENVRMLRAWAHKHDPKLEKALDRAEKQFRSQYKHHKNLAEWSAEVRPDGTPVLTADFSRLAFTEAGKDKNPHYWGAIENLQSFGKLRTDEGNAIVYDSKQWTIRIIGRDNARIFTNWIAVNDPPLSQRFDRLGISSKLATAVEGGRKSGADTYAQRLARQRSKDPSIELFPDTFSSQDERGH